MDKLHDPGDSKPGGGAIINAGAILAVLLGIWCVFVVLYGVIGVITGKKLVAGLLGALWGYMAVAGAYELLRRKFDWQRGSAYSDQHLLAGTLAVSSGIIIGAAVHETMPAVAIISALSAIKQASDGHPNKHLSALHAAVLTTGIGVGIWLYEDGIVGKALLDRIVAMP